MKWTCNRHFEKRFISFFISCLHITTRINQTIPRCEGFCLNSTPAFLWCVNAHCNALCCFHIPVEDVKKLSCFLLCTYRSYSFTYPLSWTFLLLLLLNRLPFLLQLLLLESFLPLFCMASSPAPFFPPHASFTTESPVLLLLLSFWCSFHLMILLLFPLSILLPCTLSFFCFKHFYKLAVAPPSFCLCSCFASPAPPDPAFVPLTPPAHAFVPPTPPAPTFVPPTPPATAFVPPTPPAPALLLLHLLLLLLFLLHILFLILFLLHSGLALAFAVPHFLLLLIRLLIPFRHTACFPSPIFLDHF